MISYDLQGKTAVLGMDDGKLNVVNSGFVQSFNEALDRAEADKAGAIVLTGREGTFSAGFDLKEFQKGPEASMAQVLAGFSLLVRLFEFKRPVVAACDGHAIGMGAFFLLASDLRVATDGAHKISLPESRIGMEFGAFLTAITKDRLSPKYLTRAAILSEEMGPSTALKAGFLDEIVPAGQAKARALELAAQYGAMPGVYGSNKRIIRAAALAEMRAFLKTMGG